MLGGVPNAVHQLRLHLLFFGVSLFAMFDAGFEHFHGTSASVPVAAVIATLNGPHALKIG